MVLIYAYKSHFFRERLEKLEREKNRDRKIREERARKEQEKRRRKEEERKLLQLQQRNAGKLTFVYSKTCLKRPLKKKTKMGFQDRLSLNAGQKYCRMLQGEHSAIL